LGWRDHANAFVAVLGLSSSKRQGAGVVYFKTKLWVAEPSTANALSVACHPSPAKSSVVNPSIASLLVTQLPPFLLYLPLSVLRVTLDTVEIPISPGFSQVLEAESEIESPTSF
jgi:hypothetical protein